MARFAFALLLFLVFASGSVFAYLDQAFSIYVKVSGTRK